MFQKFQRFKGLYRKDEKFARKTVGRKLFSVEEDISEINSSAGFCKKAERMAVNMPIQGASVDFIKLAMVKIDKKLEDAGEEDARCLLQIHDELLFEIKEEKNSSSCSGNKRGDGKCLPVERREC